MNALYIFPHPDDESFGPAPGIARQLREGHDVHLLTLTKGGATKLRRTFGYTIEQMGNVRATEMREVETTLGLSSMTILDFPDSGLKEVDPRDIESAVAQSIDSLKPDVIVTYAVHGVSGFFDHLVTHAVVKRVFVEKRNAGLVKRLALFTLREREDAGETHFRLTRSPDADIDCLEQPNDQDYEKFQRALDCYVTYAETIEKTGIQNLENEVAFEFFQEDYTPWVDSIFHGL